MKTLVLLLFLAITTPAGALQNQLADHPSPYLAMHGEDPVAWQDWGPEAVELAREEGKLLFVSSGYFSCHWCHVMQRESYRDQEIAKILNTHFVPVKLDRELHGALDGYLIDFVQQTQGQCRLAVERLPHTRGLPADRCHLPTARALPGAAAAPRRHLERRTRQDAQSGASHGAAAAAETGAGRVRAHGRSRHCVRRCWLRP